MNNQSIIYTFPSKHKGSLQKRGTNVCPNQVSTYPISWEIKFKWKLYCSNVNVIVPDGNWFWKNRMDSVWVDISFVVWYDNVMSVWFCDWIMLKTPPLNSSDWLCGQSLTNWLAVWAVTHLQDPITWLQASIFDGGPARQDVLDQDRTRTVDRRVPGHHCEAQTLGTWRQRHTQQGT